MERLQNPQNPQNVTADQMEMDNVVNSYYV